MNRNDAVTVRPVDTSDFPQWANLYRGYREFYARLAASLRGEGPLPVDPRDALVAIGIIESLQTAFQGVRA